MRKVLLPVIAVSIILVLSSGMSPAEAVFHFFDINEIFSNADGTIQFIEMSTSVFGQNQQQGHTFTTDSGSVFTFPTNLPSSDTAGRTFLMATPDFAKQPGNPTPDYIIPPTFFNTHGDTLNYADADRFTFADGDLPLDGIQSLNADRSLGVASPTNFAGETVSPPDPTPSDDDDEEEEEDDDELDDDEGEDDDDDEDEGE